MQKLEKYKGVKLASGQEIFSQHLIIDSSSTIPSVLPPLEREGLNASNLTQKVARGVCIASSSLQRDLSNILVIFPPRCKIYSSLFSYDHAFRMIIYMPACQLYPYFLLFIVCISCLCCPIEISHTAALNAEQLTAIRALQLSSNVAVCPQGM